MKKTILLFVCVAFLNIGAFAGNVTVQDAQTVAINFFKITLGTNAPRTVTATLQYTRTETDNTVDFYAFNMSPVKGFVIISATTNDEPIIGYSTESDFPSNFSKIGLANWLNRWSQELHYVILNNRIATPTASAHWAAYNLGVAPVSEKTGTVGPLCQTTWDQENETAYVPALYNTFCPGHGTGQAVTGCVATAMAQIMKYWSYPPVGLLSNQYDDEINNGYSANYGTLTANFADSTFAWANMPIALNNASTTTEINAIGRIMSCAGIAVDMDYDSTGSGAAVLTAEAGGGVCAQTAYVQNFGYQTVIKGIGLTGTSSGADYILTSAAFTDTIETELNESRLVQVEGTDNTYGGHTWVCDGYETSPSTMFHMNWGWSGYADGYFALTNLDPNDGDALDFSADIGALIHILPPNNSSITEHAAATLTGVCPGSPTQLSATTHTGATYSWTPTTGLSNANISNPVATPTVTTTYTVTADSAGITASSTVTITVHPVPTAAINTAADPTCYGAANGSATVTVTGGTSGYTYHWSNNETSAAITNLGPATYTVTVTDANSCTGTATKTLTQPTQLTASTTSPVDATCGQSNGSIATTVSGGTTNYHYDWSNGQTTSSATDLGAGTFTVTITDAHSCTATASATITSSGSLSLVTTATNVMCYGNTTGSATATVTGSTGTVTYHWSNGATSSSIVDVAAATYIVTISDGSGCSATSSKTISQPTALSPSVNAVTAGCGNTAANGSASVTVSGGTSGYSYHWSNGGTASSISGLVAGTYDVTITDANSCTVTAAAVVTSLPPISIVATPDNVTCYGDDNGSVQLSMSNGTAPYTYSWSNGATSSSVSNLTVGSYSVTISDAHSCSASTDISIAQPNQIQLTTGSTNATGTLDNGSATVSNIVNATAPYSYSWSNGATSQTISNMAPGTYTVTVTDDHGCKQTATAVINVSTGLNTISDVIAFTVYPNPAGNYVLVQLSDFNNATTLNLKNILGQTVITQTISAKQTQLDLSPLANGVYLVELRQGEKEAVKQLVIAR